MQHGVQTPTSPNKRTQGEMIKIGAEINEIKMKKKCKEISETKRWLFGTKNKYLSYHLFLHVCVCMYVWVNVRHGTCVEVKGELPGVGSLPPICVSGTELVRSLVLVTNAFIPDHLASTIK